MKSFFLLAALACASTVFADNEIHVRGKVQSMTCTPKVRQKTFGVLLCLKSTGNMGMQNG